MMGRYGRTTPLSKLNWRNAPGPGDLWGSPPDDDPTFVCEECGDEHDFDPKDYEDADEDGVYCTPPTLCEDCQERSRLIEAIGQYIDVAAQVEAVKFIIDSELGDEFLAELESEAKAEREAAEKRAAKEAEADQK